MTPLLRVGDDDHIRGFILNKLYMDGRWGRKSTGVHHRHTSVDNLPKSYLPKYRGKFPKIVKKMKRKAEQLIIIFKSEGKDHVCANLDRIDRGLEFCNKWRESVGLPHLNRQLREIIP